MSGLNLFAAEVEAWVPEPPEIANLCFGRGGLLREGADHAILPGAILVSPRDNPVYHVEKSRRA